MGRVWRAMDDMLDRQVAVKEMRIDGLDPEDTRTRRERTLREARATARIDHPNVVRIYDVVDEGERLWIVMELVAGRSLEQVVVEEGPLGPPAAARIGLGLVSALRQVHAGGVLHRGIKPGNVLIERRGQRVVLTDFGIAALQDAEALTMVGMLVGSPDYMAPERISGRPQGPPSDVWSLGATLCAALGGRSPFSRSTTLATLHAVLYEEPELPPVEGDLRDVLAELLEKEPSTRPGLEELEAALWPIAFPAPVPIPGASPERTPGPTRESERPPDPGPDSPEGEAAPGVAGPSGTPEGSRAPDAVTSVVPVYEESPTPVFLDPQLIREARRRPPRPEPEPGRETEAEAETEEGAETGEAEPERTREPEEASARAPGSVPGPDQDFGPEQEQEADSEPEPGSGTAPELDREHGSEPEHVPEAESESESVPDLVQDAIPVGYVPARKSPSDPGEIPVEERAATAPETGAPETRAHGTQPRETQPPETQPPETQPRETPTPAPPTEEPERPEAPTPTPTLTATSAPTAPQTPTSTPNASTEAPPERHSQVSSETPSTSPTPPTPSAASTPSSLASLASHTTAHRPAPAPMSPGELPGPSVPSAPGGRRRRMALVAAGGVVVAGAVVGIVIAAGGGSSHDTGGATASSTIPAGSRTTSGAPSSPPPTVDGTSRPPSLPAGAREEAGLYAWVPPQDWQRVAQSGSEVHYTSPDSAQEIVANATPARGDLLAQWQQAEGDTSKGLDYRRIRLEQTTFRGEPAVAWEYTVMAKGRLWHVRLLGFRSGGTSYEISTWYHPDIESAALRVYDEVRNSFTPL
ncbi:protein kinase domain-containing protein [Streptomyces fagopyri]